MKQKFNKGYVECIAPSNIALVKYWGKKQTQIPLNASISFSLSACQTKTKAEFSFGQEERNINFFFHGEKTPSFIPKIETFITRVEKLYPWLSEVEELTLKSENSFPHSSGIASSASAFAALAYCFEVTTCKLEGHEFNHSRASEAARLGSGSACRSVFGNYNLWGELSATNGNNNCSQELNNIHKNFRNVRDAICIASSGEKSVGSTAGHALMNGHVYGEQRIEQAQQNCTSLLSYLEKGDLWKAGEIIEEEALSLHALMMSSRPSFILMKPNTLKMIEIVRNFRQTQNIPVFFTLDAGPNPHIIYFEEGASLVESKLLEELRPHCEQGRIIMDSVGAGPKVLESFFE